MITDSTKRQTGLNLLQRLRRQGLPAREEKMESMFDSLTGNDEEEKSGDGDTDSSPEYELQSPEQQAKEREKTKGPKLDPGKVDRFKKGFFGTK